ncbi:RDD family protein [Aquibacillus sp. 3ASR75-11]|uniref:RDD family protein n=1 Tax=Terrihalobacillus insolitus TaxID=2950438 RepID=A0A9X3WQK6_9BACI|nr:RDD family protein [Terrihalobacillus insolitus]MDC3412409.1 RDD family protein [Terrihalobacillus insolitus]MDC3422898.1 RDD family protein [Terrihalobacillus insolitus]
MEKAAGFKVRFLASLLDWIVVTIILGFITFLMYGEFFYTEQFNITDFLGVLYSIIVPVIWYGYTIGKRMTNIRIVKVSGQKVTLITMLLRVIGGFIVYAFSLGIAFIISAFMVGIREDKRAIHDFIAGTYVTYK